MKEIEGLWALNTKKGTTIRNDDIGELPGVTCVPIDERQRAIAKHLLGVVIVEKIIMEK
jgi:hypothetical protein